MTDFFFLEAQHIVTKVGRAEAIVEEGEAPSPPNRKLHPWFRLKLVYIDSAARIRRLDYGIKYGKTVEMSVKNLAIFVVSRHLSKVLAF